MQFRRAVDTTAIKLAVLENTVAQHRMLTEERFLSRDKAVEMAVESMQKRLEGMNEFRQTLSDQATKFLPRTEYQSTTTATADRISTLSSRMDRAEGSDSKGSSAQSSLISIIALIISGVIAGVTVVRALSPAPQTPPPPLAINPPAMITTPGAAR
jgi:hypothetical protein